MKTGRLSAAGAATMLAVLPTVTAHWRALPYDAAGRRAVAALQRDIASLDVETSDLQRRLEALERTAPGYAGGQISMQGGVTVVRAPFEVLDTLGKPILRVSEAGDTKRGLMVLNDAGGLASQVAVAEGGGGRVVAYAGTPNVAAHIGMQYATDGPLFEATRPDATMMAQVAGQGFVFFNKAGTAVAKLGSNDGGAGFFQLANRNGNAIVEAGLHPDGVGIVRAYPCCGPPPVPIPGFIMGKK